jgi:hypothetical protein
VEDKARVERARLEEVYGFNVWPLQVKTVRRYMHLRVRKAFLALQAAFAPVAGSGLTTAIDVPSARVRVSKDLRDEQGKRLQLKSAVEDQALGPRLTQLTLAVEALDRLGVKDIEAFFAHGIPGEVWERNIGDALSWATDAVSLARRVDLASLAGSQKPTAETEVSRLLRVFGVRLRRRRRTGAVGPETVGYWRFDSAAVVAAGDEERPCVARTA